MIDVLEKVGVLGVPGDAIIIHHDRGHPMKELIYPLRTFVKTGPREQLVRSMEEEPVNSIELAKRLRKTTLFSHIEPD